MSQSPNAGNAIPAEFDGWFAEHPDQSRADFEEIWRLAVQADAPFLLDPDRVDSMRAAVESEMDRRVDLRIRTLGSRWVWLSAAVFVVALGSLWLFAPVTHFAPAGTSEAVELSDGSTVTLNAGSTLRHAKWFGRLGRSTELVGEAFFSVRPGQASFEVSTFNGQIEVVGTRFNVRARPNERGPATLLWVEEGVVKVSPRGRPEESVSVTAGGSAEIIGSKIARVEPDRHRDAATWRDGGFAFSNTLLSDILDEVERRFDVRVDLSPDSLGRIPISLHVTNVDDPSKVLELVAAAHDLELTSSPAGYLLTSN